MPEKSSVRMASRFSFAVVMILTLSRCASGSLSLPSWMPGWVPGTDEYRATQAAERRAESIEDRQMAIHDAVQHGDITLGMTREQVRQAWGEPRARDYAGDSASGNERWTYTLGVSSYWSIQPKRIVYFDRGLVAGWESER